MRPPFEITPKSATLLAKIEYQLGLQQGTLAAPTSPKLRRSQRVRTIHSSLAIEGNTLTEDQVTAVLEGKTVIAPARDLTEVTNAIACYEKLATWTATSPKHLLAAHRLMMRGLIDRPGTFRQAGAGIARGNTITHVAPPADRVPALIGSLLTWLESADEIPPPILAAIVHYELEFIHPFQDGNGRIGRLWHTLILTKHHPIFAHVPVESAIRDRQAEYYAVLERCDNAGNSTAFIEFALETTLQALLTITGTTTSRMTIAERIDQARAHFGTRTFTRKDYLGHFPALSPPTASRDLQRAVSQGHLTRSGDKATARYHFTPPRPAQPSATPKSP